MTNFLPMRAATSVVVLLGSILSASAHDVWLSIAGKPASRRAIVVPAAAVLQSGLSTRVMVERGPLRFEPRTVEVGASHGDQVEIVSGLKAGERIVVKEGVLLND